MRKIEAALELLQRRDPRLTFRVDEALGVVRYLRGNLLRVRKGKAGHVEAAVAFLRSQLVLFGKVGLSGMKLLHEAADPGGGRTLVLQQFHHGHRVHGGRLRLHFTAEGVLDTLSSTLFPDLARVARKARLGAEAAVAAAQRRTRCSRPPARPPELLVLRHADRPRLAWEVRLDDVKPGERGAPAKWITYVDATSGVVLLSYDNVQTAGPVVASGTGYYSGTGPVQAWFNDVTNQLRDTTRATSGGPEIVTNDEDGASPSEDADANWNDATTTPRHAHQGPEVDAHRYTAAVVDYYRTVHGRNGFDGAGGGMTNLVHFGADVSNGYWDGARVNLGDGSGVAATGDDYECSDDWLAHEWTHAYTERTCALAYLNESGALNEAFSDVFAAFITGDWLVFEDTWLKTSAPAWRNMIDPTNGGQWDATQAPASVLAGHQPSHYGNRYTGAWDNGGVHVNSGIINNLFYLLTVGGTHGVSGVAVTGIGQSAAEQLLFRCMSVNLVGQPNATFLDFREAMLDACLDLFPTDLHKLAQVKNAFHAVGIGPDIFVRDNLLDGGEEPYPGTSLWASPDVINRTAPVADPAVDLGNLADDGLWQNVEAGQDNHVYVRVQNRGPQQGDASVNVYFSAASTFGTPASWIHIGSLAGAAIAPGAARVLGPLTFPRALIPGSGHYCMIAVLSSALDPAPDHDLIASVADYLEFVRGTNNIAYRNMDVVNLVPDAPGTVTALVRSLGHRERFDLLLDHRQFVPGARLLLRGPRSALDGAVAHGLKLVARNEGENLYEPLAGRELARQRDFLGLGAGGPEKGTGFHGVLVDEPFRLTLEYVLPGAPALKALGRQALRRGFRLGLRQVWRGQGVGAAALRLQVQAEKGAAAGKARRRARR